MTRTFPPLVDAAALTRLLRDHCIDVVVNCLGVPAPQGLDLWIEPLGALVKTGPAIVLMLVALLTLDNR
jgi:hypothetical protein